MTHLDPSNIYISIIGIDQSSPQMSTGLWDGAFRLLGMYR